MWAALIFEHFFSGGIYLKFISIFTDATGHSTQFFAGYLAGLSILNGKSENERVLKCITVCQEKLDFHAMQDMESGMVSITVM